MKKNILDDLDLSDDGTESSDFTEFDPKATKENGKASKDPDLETGKVKLAFGREMSGDHIAYGVHFGKKSPNAI